MKKLLAFAGIMLLLHFPFSCDYSSSGYKYTVESIALLAGKVVDYQVVAYPFDPQNDTLQAAIFGIQLTAEYTSGKISLHSGFILSCVAEPAPPTQDVELISITSDKKVITSNITFESGELLTPIFNVSEYSYQESLADFLTRGGYWELWSPLVLTFSEPIQQPLNQKFFIKIVLGDGQVFDLETENVIVKP